MITLLITCLCQKFTCRSTAELPDTKSDNYGEKSSIVAAANDDKNSDNDYDDYKAASLEYEYVPSDI